MGLVKSKNRLERRIISVRAMIFCGHRVLSDSNNFFSGSLCGAVGFHFNCYEMRKYFYALIIFKVKIFRSQMCGVRDRDFFIFRLVKLYA